MYRPFRNETLPLDVENGVNQKEAEWFRFEACYQDAKCRAEHFQLKHCLQAGASEELYYTGPVEGEISVFDPLTRESRVVVSLSPRMAITCFSLYEGLVATGGLNGQLYLDTLDGEVKARHFLAPPEQESITNTIHFVSFRGAAELMIGSNNKSVTFLDPEVLGTPKRSFLAEYNVNCLALAGNSRLLALAGDSTVCHVLETDRMQPLMRLEGHKDHNFSAAWHPTKDHLLVTGGQDMTMRVWDLRAAGDGKCTPLCTLFGEVAAVLNVQFTQDGELLAWSETIDYVHITESTLFAASQKVDFFGEISGLAFSRESASPASLFVGICDPTYNSVYEVRRRMEIIGLADSV